jgi:hypothetical protein
VDLSDDLPPPRRALFFPVVIATVFLSIIGMSVGLVLGSRQKAEDRRADRRVEQQQQQQQAVPTASPVTRPSGAPCLPETQDQAQLVGVAGQLTQVLRLRTRTSVVYICVDEAGSMYYHANNGGDTWVEGETALFLPNVVRDADGYRVTAGDGTSFSVNRKRLFIVHKDGTPETQPAT